MSTESVVSAAPGWTYYGWILLSDPQVTAMGETVAEITTVEAMLVFEGTVLIVMIRVQQIRMVTVVLGKHVILAPTVEMVGSGARAESTVAIMVLVARQVIVLADLALMLPLPGTVASEAAERHNGIPAVLELELATVQGGRAEITRKPPQWRWSLVRFMPCEDIAATTL